MSGSNRLAPGLFARLMWRETHGSRGRFGFFVLCLAIGVAAVVCVAGLTRNLDRSIRAEARQLLAADLTVSGVQPLSPDIEDFLRDHPEIEATRVAELVTMAVRPDRGLGSGTSQLVELKVVGGKYPFYGTLDLDPDAPLADLLRDGGVVVAPDLMTRLDLGPGGSLRIGSETFAVSGQVLREPDRAASPFTLGPRVFLSDESFARSGLEEMGSRIVYRALLRLPAETSPARLAEIAESIRAIVGGAGPYRVQTYVESQEELREALQRAASFLGLVALLSLLLGGLGIAQTTRAWLVDRMDDIAILRCLGVRPREVVGLYLGQSTLLALAPG